MASSDDDADVQLALALSLQQSLPIAPSPNNEAIDLTSDTEDNNEDIARAIALSLQASASPTNSKPLVMARGQPIAPSFTPKSKSEQPIQSTTGAAPSAEPKKPATPFGLDRKAMEQERLARLSKRKRDPPPDRPSKQITKMSSTDVTSTPNLQSSFSPSTTLSYPKGAIKRTFATKFPRTDDITIDEVLQAEHVNTAVISSFMWDSEWLNKKLDPSRVKQIWIMNAKGVDVQKRWRQEMHNCGIPNLKIHFPPMNGQIHSMHSKFMLLFSKVKLRLVVPTANMTPIDWGEVKNNWQPGVMENSVFLIDLPRMEDGSVTGKGELTILGKDLIHFLEQQEVDRKVIDGVLRFDFSQTGHLAFVHSIGGTHKSESQHPTGLPGLTQAVCDLQLGDVQNIELDYAASSLGAVNDTLLQRIHLAARGKTFATTTSVPNVRDHIRIYFPTDEAVQRSIGGPDCGGIISLARQYYNAANFPRECLRNYDSTRRGMLSHNKLLFVRGVKKDGTPFAWVYIGSANISDSAWGGQKVLKSGQIGSLNIRNWECGVVVPVEREKIVELKLGDGEIPPMSVFEGTIEVPFVHPGQPYGAKQPWFFRSI